MQMQEAQLSQLRTQVGNASKNGDEELLKTLDGRLSELREKVEQILC